ncbi:MAG: zinc ABC transporter substrate-binding protein [Alphaproteobacteria bacterium]|nr:zinc ABC transporter substrate-binding protein [Alphaproteobacteria bacterium]
MHPKCLAIAVLIALSLPPLLSGAIRAAEAPAVVASILPVHSLVAGVMDGVGTPHLLLPGGASPHAYALRPSDARQLSDARIVFWVGEALETFLERPLAALARKARVVELLEAKGLVRLPLRSGGVWDSHAEDSAGRKGNEPDDHHHKDDHYHKGVDAHVWLDPANARTIVVAAAAALAEVDPANAARYASNANAMDARLRSLDTRLKNMLQPVANKTYIVFHDAYQYLEWRYGLGAAGAVTVSPGRSPGARRLIEIRTQIRAAKAACVFIEPQFEPRIAETVVDGTGARIAVLDPLGAALAPGKEAYFALMEGLASALVRCLAAR